jgi:magnesium-transporting ATPase (P-type)
VLVWHIALVSVLFLGGVFGIHFYAIDRGHSLELARTLAVNTLVVMEIFHLFFIRNFYNTSLTWQAVRGTKVVWLVVAIIATAQIAMTYLPALQAVFATEAVPFWDGVLVMAIGAALFAILETEKQIRLQLRVVDRPAGAQAGD